MSLRLEFVQGPLLGQHLIFAQAEVVLGRDPTCEVPLVDGKVSRRHARFVVTGGRYFVEDLGSTNGVLLNGQRIGARVPVSEGDRVLVGDSAIVVHLTAAGTPAPGEENHDGTVLAGKRAPDFAGTAIAPPPAPAPRQAGRRTLLAVVILLALGGIAYVLWPGLAHPAAPVAPGTVSATTAPLVLVPLLPPDSTAPDAAAPGSTATPLPPAVAEVAPPPAPTPTPAPVAPIPTPVATTPAAPVVPAPPSDATATYLWLDTKPSDAAVELDGKAVGRTPLFLANQPEMRHYARFTKDGYDPLPKLLEVPNNGDLQTYTLVQQKATCLVTSEPPGAAILTGSQVLGHTPCLLRAPTGSDTIDARLVLPHYQAEVVVLKFEADRPTTLQRVLKPAMGTLVLVVTPAGAQVQLDDFNAGPAPAAGPGEHQAKPLTFAGLKAGDHTVTISYQGVTLDPVTVTVEIDKTVTAEVVLWLPDREVTLKNGKVVSGMILRDVAGEPLALVTAPGAKPVTLALADVQATRVLPLEEGLKLRQAEKDERRKREMREKLEKMRKDDPNATP